MTNQIFVISASSLEGSNGHIEPEKSVVWSRFHQDYQPQYNTGQTDQRSPAEAETEDQDITSESEDNADKEDHEDFIEDEEDIFTKSLAPEHLDLKNFLTVEERKKKISQISEIIAYNIGPQKQVCNNSMMEFQMENIKTFFDKQERNYWRKIFCCCWYI